MERVLATLLDLSFVLTDREGFVTRWTPRAEKLFGMQAADAAGRALLETLGAPDADVPAAGRVQIAARHKEGHEFRAELTFVPVPMSHSLEFNGFLESLESDRPTKSVLQRVNSQHSDVLDWIGSVVTDGVPLHSDELTAGTIVAFRPLGEVAWLEEDESEPAAPASGGDSGLADAVDRAAEVLARSDAIERTLDEAGEAVEEVRATAEAAREEASGAAQRVSELADENASLREELARVHGEELNALRAEVEGLTARIDAESAASAQRIEAMLGEVRDLGTGEGGGGEAADAAAQRAEEALEAVQALAAELRAELQDARDAASQAREAAEAAAVEAKLARTQAEAARVHSEEADGHAQSAREVAEAWASAAEKHRAPAGNGRAAVPRRKLKQDEPPARDPRPGFDDASSPMAVIGLDGRFRDLNPRFSELVGYKEHDFHTASWPPVVDRAKLDHHREQMRAMLAGELESVEVDTGYVHAQGLPVPVAGTLSLVRDDDGEPSHFLLAVRSPTPAAAS